MGVKLTRLKRYIIRNKWKVTFFIVGFLFVLEVLIASINYYKIYNYNNDIDKLQSNIDSKKEKLENWKSKKNYKKYQIVKNIDENIDSISWNKTINSLISIFNKLKDLEKEEESIVLEDFKVEMESVSLKGKTYSMKSVYKSGGIIDRFKGLSFVENFSIPFYKKQGDSYNFSLDANISTNEQ